MEKIKEKMRALLQEQVEEGEFPSLSLLVIKNGKEWLFTSAGWADIGERKPIQRDSIFRLYSLTKPITGAAVLLLEERGVLSLTQKLSDFFPEYKKMMVRENKREVPAWRELRLQDLMNMVSGISYGTNPVLQKIIAEQTLALGTKRALSTQEFVRNIAQAPLEAQPGSHWMYGLSADVLGGVIEVATKKSLSDFLREEIFTPLGMSDTGFYVSQDCYHRLVTPYHMEKGVATPVTKNMTGVATAMKVPPVFASGGGGLVSTIDDYAAFAQMLLAEGVWKGKQIFKKSTIQKFTTSKLNSRQREPMELYKYLDGYNYGNLLRILTDPQRARVRANIGEYGWEGLMGCYYGADPESGSILLLMTQKVNAGMVPLARTLQSLVTSKEKESE